MTVLIQHEQAYTKLGHSRPLVHYFRLFNTVDSKCSIFFFCRWLDSNHGPLARKRPLYQLSPTTNRVSLYFVIDVEGGSPREPPFDSPHDLKKRNISLFPFTNLLNIIIGLILQFEASRQVMPFALTAPNCTETIVATIDCNLVEINLIRRARSKPFRFQNQVGLGMSLSWFVGKLQTYLIKCCKTIQITQISSMGDNQRRTRHLEIQFYSSRRDKSYQ